MNFCFYQTNIGITTGHLEFGVIYILTYFHDTVVMAMKVILTYLITFDVTHQRSISFPPAKSSSRKTKRNKNSTKALIKTTIKTKLIDKRILIGNDREGSTKNNTHPFITYQQMALNTYLVNPTGLLCGKNSTVTSA